MRFASKSQLLLAILFGLLLALGLRGQGQEPRKATRIESYTWDANLNVVSWEATRIRINPDGRTAEQMELLSCRIEFARERLICNDRVETLNSVGRQHLEDDIYGFQEHLLQLSSPVLWGERAGK